MTVHRHTVIPSLTTQLVADTHVHRNQKRIQRCLFCRFCCRPNTSFTQMKPIWSNKKTKNTKKKKKKKCTGGNDDEANHMCSFHSYFRSLPTFCFVNNLYSKRVWYETHTHITHTVRSRFQCSSGR